MGSQHRIRGLVAFALLALVGSWPYFATIGYWPMTSDPPIWIGRGSLANPEWYRWVFLQDHFTWYRPLAAFSFTLNGAVGGLNPLLYRLTDLGLHLLAGFLVMRLAGSLNRGRSTWMPLLAAAIFLAHPGVEEVVPFMARRSYSLSMVLGLGALCLLARAPDGEAPASQRPGPIAVAGGLLACAFLSNEAAAVIVPIALGLTLSRARSTGAGARWNVQACVLLAAPFGAALVARSFVLDSVGGYEESAAAATGVAENLRSIASDLTGIAGWIEADPGDGWLGLAALVLVAVVFLAGVFVSLKNSKGELALLLAWIAGYVALFLWYGLWVGRQIYPLLPPFAILSALLVAIAVERRRHSPLASGLSMVVLLAMLGGLLQSSPLLAGQDAERLESWAVRQSLLTQLDESLSPLEGPATVHLVLPDLRGGFRTAPRNGELLVHQSMRHPALWAMVLTQGRDIEVSDLMYFDGVHGAPTLEADRTEPDRRDLMLQPGGRCLLRTREHFEQELKWKAWTPGFVRRSKTAPRAVPLRDLDRRPGVSSYLFIGSTSGGELHLLSDH